MSIENYLVGDDGHSRPSYDEADRAQQFAEEMLRRLEHLPPSPTDEPKWVPSGAECAMTMVGDHWGVYGAGVTKFELSGRTSPQLMLDPAWLDHDFRRLGAREPSILAGEAEWATPKLSQLLGLIPPETVLRATLPPEPYSVASGETTTWPSATSQSSAASRTGCLGPAVSYQDALGKSHDGFLTAGHVAPSQAAGGSKDVDLGPAGNATTLPILTSRTPTGLGSGLGAHLKGAVDAAVVSAGGATVSGIGSPTPAGHTAYVERVTSGSTQSGYVVGYAVWVATTASAWCDCYTVAASGTSFADEGHSGAAVTYGPAGVIGIVVGGAQSIPGCASALTYVQDIDAITKALGCALIP